MVSCVITENERTDMRGERPEEARDEAASTTDDWDEAAAAKAAEMMTEERMVTVKLLIRI